MNTRSLTLFFAVFVSVGALAVGAGAASSVIDLGTDTPIGTDEAVLDYKDGNAVGGDVAMVDMSITLSPSHEGVGLGDSRFSSLQHQDRLNHYLRVNYREDIDRTVRFCVRGEYFYPTSARNIDSVDGESSISLAANDDGSCTVVEMDVDGETDEAVFKIPRSASTGWWLKSQPAKIVDKSTGIEIPTIQKEDDWQYVPASSLGGEDVTMAVEQPQSELVLEYDRGGEQADWQSIPQCSRSSTAPVCQFNQVDNEDTTYVLSRTSSPPPVRYKEAGRLAGISSGFGDGIGAFSDGLKNISDLIGGD